MKTSLMSMFSSKEWKTSKFETSQEGENSKCNIRYSVFEERNYMLRN